MPHIHLWNFWNYLETLLRASKLSKQLYDTFLIPYKDCGQIFLQKNGKLISLDITVDGTNSEKFEVSRGANTISFSTSEAVGEMDSNVRDKISSNSSYQTRKVEALTEQRPFESPSPPIRRERESDPGKGALKDIPSLLNLLKSNTRFKEISSDKVLYDREITDFIEVYGISNKVYFFLVSTDGDIFWLEDTADAIYIWSCIESSMQYVGPNLREALINYLFHQDNICYIIEETHEIITKQQLDQEIRERANSIE
ncbi:1925_t:CDS:2, partial [Funneliformis geosporum]